MAYEGLNMDQFNVPRRSSLAVPLIALARENRLTPEHLEETRARVEGVYRGVIEQVEADGSQVETYAQGVVAALNDSCTLIFFGLEEMADPSRVRLGQLLIEKGEEEYLAILAELKREEQADDTQERGVDLWGRLAEKLAECGEDEAREAIVLARTTFRAQVEGMQRDFERATEILGGDPETAERRMLVSLIRFHDFLGLEP